MPATALALGPLREQTMVPAMGLRSGSQDTRGSQAQAHLHGSQGRPTGQQVWTSRRTHQASGTQRPLCAAFLAGRRWRGEEKSRNNSKTGRGSPPR